MAPVSPGEVTQLLRAWSDGDEGALERLLPLVEAELRRLARVYMRRERPEHTLQVTALVNEAFLRLTDATQVQWNDRAHFLGISARLMRRVLIDHARGRGYRKRGGGAQRVALEESLVAKDLSGHRADQGRQKPLGLLRVREQRFDLPAQVLVRAARVPALRQKLAQLEARKAEIDANTVGASRIPPLLHVNMAARWRSEIMDLHQALVENRNDPEATGRGQEHDRRDSADAARE